MTFRKWIAVLLCFTMLLPMGLTAFAAGGDADSDKEAAPMQVTVADSLESAFAEGENSLLLFVTGIGQSFSYLFDESYLAPDAFESGTLQDYENYAPLIANGKYTARWNLFNDFSEQFGRAETKQTVAKLVFQLILTLFARRNMMKDADIRAAVKQLFAFNLVDENGDHDPRVITPRYTCPVSEYPEGVEADGGGEPGGARADDEHVAAPDARIGGDGGGFLHGARILHPQGGDEPQKAEVFGQSWRGLISR